MNNDVMPIFIMGAPRSGTTLLASSIASHSQIIALPEMHYLYKLMEEEAIHGFLSERKKIEILQN